MIEQLTIYLGDDVNQLFQVTKNGLPVDLTAVTDISVVFQNDPSETLKTYTAKKSTGQIVVATALLGTFNLILSAAVTAKFLAPQLAVDMDIVVLDSSSKTLTYRVRKALNIVSRYP